MSLALRRVLRFILAVALLGAASTGHAAVCQFIPTSGAWNVPANWANCTGGNGVPAGTPGNADRAEITAKTAILPAGTFDVGDLYLGAAIIQGAGSASTTLNVTAAGTIAWGSGNYDFQSIFVTVNTVSPMFAISGPLTLTDARFDVLPGATVHFDAVNLAGGISTILHNFGTFVAHGNITSQAATTGFFNAGGGVFQPNNSLQLAGPFQNQGVVDVGTGITLSLAAPVGFASAAPTSELKGTGTISSPGQVLVVTNGLIKDNLTFNVGTLHNAGATMKPGGFAAIGTLTVNGNFSQTAPGSIEFELAGLGSVDQLLVSGTANLGGNLHRGALGTFAPPVGTVLDIIVAGAVSGTFNSGSEQILFDAPRRYTELYTATKVQLQASGTVWVVGTNDDVSPTAPSLRNALNRFNAESGASCLNAPYEIHFLLPPAELVIAPASALPQITGCPGLLIDGYTQSGASPNTSTTDWNGVTPVVLNGTGCTPSCTGITMASNNNVVQGIHFINWSIATAPAATGSKIGGNYFEQGLYHVYHVASQGVQIGASGLPAKRNVFVNAFNPIYTTGQAGGPSLLIQNNLIGAGAGLAPSGNSSGIYVNGSNNVVIADNYIANNTTSGLSIAAGTGINYASNNVFVGNAIAIDLGADGPTANDEMMPPYDTDSGPNQRINFARILSVTPTSASSANITWELRSSASSNFSVTFCKNPAGGSQCEQMVSPALAAATDANGLYTTTVGLIGLTTGTVITAFTTATSGPKAGNSSELSPGVAFAPSAPALTITGSGTFPNTVEGASSAVQTITLQNTGSANLTINTINFANLGVFRDTTSGPPPNSAHYCGLGSNAAGQPTTAPPVTLTPGQTCQLNMVFAPTSSGTFTPTMQVFSDAPGSPHSINFSGTAAAPSYTLSPAISFGNVTVGQMSAPQTVTFTNTSPVSLTITAVPNSSNAVFSATPAGATPCTASLVVPSMGSCTFSSVFTPPAVSMYSGSFNLPLQAVTSTFAATSAVDGNGVAAPSATYAPIGLNFGSVVVGNTSASMQVTFTNTSASILTISGISFIGGGAGFNILASSQCLMTPMLAPMAACTFDITATPPGIGSFTDTVYVTTLPASATTPANVSLAVTGAAAATPSMTVAFAPGSVAAGANAILTVSLSNPAASAAGIGAGSVTLPAGLNGVAPMSNTCGTFGSFSGQTYGFGMGSIPAMGSCTIDLTVSAPAPGTYTVTVMPGALSAGGMNTNTSSSALTVTPAATPGLTLSPPSLGFATQTVGTTSAVMTSTLTSSGTAPVLIAGMAISGDFNYTTNCPFSPTIFPVGNSCQLNVTFSPLTAGPQSGVLPISSNAAVSPSLALSGTGAPTPVAGIALSASAFSFGNVPVGSNSVLHTLVVSNTGLSNLVLSSITVSPPFSRNPLPLNTPPDCGTSVAPGANCAIGLFINPSFTGSFSGTVTIVHNAGTPSVVSLVAAGVAAAVPGISVAPVLDFGNVVRGTRLTRALAITNTGTAALAVGTPVLRGSTMFGVTGNCASVAPGASCDLQVEFAPTALGAAAAELDIPSNAAAAPVPVPPAPTAAPVPKAASPVTVALKGNGILAPVPVAELNMTAIGFGNSLFAGASNAQTVTLKNTGSVPLAVTALFTTGEFVQTNSCGGSVGSDASCVITVTFNPLSMGFRQGELIVHTNAAGSPHRVLLSGTGCRWFAQPQSRLLLTACGG